MAILTGAGAAGGCQVTAQDLARWTPFWTLRRDADLSSPLGKGLRLQLPQRPGFPEEVTLVQTVIGRHGERRAAFQAVLELGGDETEIVLTTAGGPRILGLLWNADGVVEDRTPLAPEGLSGLSILGDIFLSTWPADAVARALPAGATLEDKPGLRRVVSGGRTLVEIVSTPAGDGGLRQELHNLDFDYRLTIVTQAAE